MELTHALITQRSLDAGGYNSLKAHNSCATCSCGRAGHLCRGMETASQASHLQFTATMAAAWKDLCGKEHKTPFFPRYLQLVYAPVIS